MHDKKESKKDRAEGGEKGAGECLGCNELEHKYRRALADYQNLLKQTAREKEEFAKFANTNLLYEILPVYDNLKISLEHTDEAAKTNGWLTGVNYVIKQFKEALGRAGVEEIEAADQAYNHDLMDAAGEEATDDPEKDGRVAKILKTGYKLNGKVIMPAKVVVWKYKRN